MWRYSFLVVEDDHILTDELRYVYGARSHVIWSCRIQDALAQLEFGGFDVIVTVATLQGERGADRTDVYGDIDALRVAKAAREKSPFATVIVLYRTGAQIRRRELERVAGHYGARVLSYPAATNQDDMIMFAEQVLHEARAAWWRRRSLGVATSLFGWVRRWTG